MPRIAFPVESVSEGLNPVREKSLARENNGCACWTCDLCARFQISLRTSLLMRTFVVRDALFAFVLELAHVRFKLETGICPSAI